MKTININLIGELDKAPEFNKAVIKKDNLDASTKIFIIIYLIGIFVVFVFGFGIWLIADNLGKKHSIELKALKDEQQKLSKEHTELSIYRKNLQEDLEIAKFKQIARNQINSSFIPWSSILKELATKVPRNVIVSSIDKTSFNRSKTSVNRLSISGIVPASSRSRVKPFTAVSFLILNINEDKDSLLYDAEIKTVEYKTETNIYEFVIETGIRKEQAEKNEQPG